MNTTKKYKPLRTICPAEVEAARELYLRYGPSEHSQIVRAMIAGGWRAFRIADLEGRPWRDFAGLVKMNGWREEWRRMNEPEAAAVAETGAEKAAAAETAAEADAAAGEEKSLEMVPKKPFDFPSWLEAARPGWEWRNTFQKLIYRELLKITTGKKMRLMIFMPPRHGKSELVTVRYAAWRLRSNPKLRIVVSSYNQRLANRFSRYIKSVYLGAPDIDLAEDSDERDLVLNTMDEWETSGGGGVKAVGAGAGITGFGADLIIIDDPIKSRADAESKNNRTRVWEWFTDDLMTRLEPGGAIILIQTRWHEDDLAGRLLKQQVQGSKFKVQGRRQKTALAVGSTTLNLEPGTLNSTREWSVVSLPALAEPGNAGSPACIAADAAGEVGDESMSKEPNRTNAKEFHAGGTGVAGKGACVPRDRLGRKPGEALWPKRFSSAALLERKAEMGSYSFAALYQQRPVPSGGALFKRDWFARIVAYAPADLRWCRGYDLAVSTKTSADYTASFRVALDKKTGDLYIADGFRARIEFPDQRKYIVGRIQFERDTEHGIEEALHGQAFVQELWREERLTRSAFRGVRVTADKFTRALAWANRAEAGKIVLVRGAWIDDFLDEVTHFPNAAHDDQVDAVSLAVQMMETRKNVVWAF